MSGGRGLRPPQRLIHSQGALAFLLRPILDGRAAFVHLRILNVDLVLHTLQLLQVQVYLLRLPDLYLLGSQLLYLPLQPIMRVVGE